MVDYGGVKAWRFHLDDKVLQKGSENPDNKKYNLDMWNGVYSNLTSSKQLPAFVTQKHFWAVEKELTDKVKIFTNVSKTEEVVA